MSLQHDSVAIPGKAPIMIRDAGLVIGAMWVAFVAFWIFEATRAKRAARGSALPSLVRALVLIAIFLLIRISFGMHLLRGLPGPIHPSPIVAITGAAVCALGIGVAMWARVYLGRNWGMPMSLREGHELVTTGPYALVRHPIYTGILLALVGTAAVQARWPSLVLLVFFFAYFIYAAKVEERTMREQFPVEYPAYVRRTRMLIPFVL
jgi:protein-S-isoprenylcysteine O-methyltransferase Ste14